MFAQLIRFCPLVLICAWAQFHISAEPEAPSETSHCRHPVALALNQSETRLLAANERMGTVTLLDAETLAVVNEFPVARRLADLRRLPQANQFLALDPQEHQLLLLELDSDRLVRKGVWPVSPHPVNLQISSDGRRVAVASLWSRRCQVFQVACRSLAAENSLEEFDLELERDLALPFEPFRQLLAGDKLIVTAAFGGRIAVIDLNRGQVESVRELRGHNLRGLAWDESRRQVVLSHQILNTSSPTGRSDVQWGFLMTNQLRFIPLADLLNPEADLESASYFASVGNAEDPAGDPDHLLCLPDGRIVLCLAGRGEIAVMDLRKPETRRVALGQRPLFLLPDRGYQRIYVALAFSDAVALLDLNERLTARRERLGPRHEWSLSDQGEHHFYDANFSFRGWLSCHSCHTEGHSNGLVNDNEGDDSFGAPKRILSLLGAGATLPWGWNGRQFDLQEQVHKSVVTTMQGYATDEQAAALAAFLRTLAFPPPAPVQNPEAVAQGRLVFERERCHRCHEPPLFTSRETYDVGLADERGQTEFNPPTLRGVNYRPRLFHDNRASNLEAVFRQYRHQISDDLPEADLENLLAYLRSL